MDVENGDDDDDDENETGSSTRRIVGRLLTRPMFPCGVRFLSSSLVTTEEMS